MYRSEQTTPRLTGPSFLQQDSVERTLTIFGDPEQSLAEKIVDHSKAIRMKITDFTCSSQVQTVLMKIFKLLLKVQYRRNPFVLDT